MHRRGSDRGDELMEDISKGTVTLLLVIAVILTGVFAWQIMNSGQTIILQQPESQPGSSGQVRIGIYPPGSIEASSEISDVSEIGGNMKVIISKGG